MTEELKMMPLDKLEQDIGELAAELAAATCRWLLMVAEFDRRDGWAHWGTKSCSEWLSWRCGVAPRAAREQVRVARRLAELPLVRHAFSRGELSYSKVRAISRVAGEETEADLVELAQHATAAQLERLVRGYRGVLSAELDQANHAHAMRYLDWWWDDDGALVVSGRLPAEDGALVVKALEAAADELRNRERAQTAAEEGGSAEPPPEPGGSAEPPQPPEGAEEPTVRGTAAPTRADALVSMAESLLSNGITRRSGGERYLVTLHVEHQALADDEPGRRCQLDDGPAVPAETARRIACDASVVKVVVTDGQPLGVGRKTRSNPPAVRRALHSRDHGCCFPACNQRRFVDAHHIRHWAHGGDTDLSNLLLLCRRHHRLVHEGGYRVEARAGRPPLFRRPDGTPIPAVPRNRLPGAKEAGTCILHGQVKPGTYACTARSAGDPLDYGMAIESLLRQEGLLDVPAARQLE